MVARWPLVGRDDELTELRRLLGATAPARGVAVFGDAGVGKTRLVTETVEACRSEGARVEWVRATEAARTIPLGSFAHLLDPDDDAHHRDDLLHLALGRLHRRAGSGDDVLAVDDAHLLDETSVALLHLAVTQTPVRVLLSVRTGEPLPLGLVALWKDELVTRHDVAPLDRAATEALVLAVVGDGVPASLLDRVWVLSQGNPLFVRELITAAVERRAGGAGGPLRLSDSPGDRLRDLVEERLRLLEPSRRAALDVIAVGESVPLDVAERLAATADIEALEERHLVELVDDPAGETTSVLQVAHPLYGEIVAGDLPRLRRRSLLRELVAAVGESGRVDRLRLAVWRLESGSPGDPDQLLALAQEALGRLDHELAERLARAAGGTGRADVGLVLAEALSGQGRIEDAARVLAELRPTSTEVLARVAIARASDLFLQLDRSSDAFAVLRSAADDLVDDPDPEWRAECRSVLAQMLMFSMGLPEAGAIADELLADPATPGSARVRAVSVAVTVRGAAGRLDEALALIDDDLYAEAHRHRREVPYGDIQLRMARFQALYWAGDAHALMAHTDDDMGLGLTHPPPSLRGIVAGFRGGALLGRGRAEQALAELEISSRTLAESDWFGQRPLAEAIRARAAVYAGRLDLADEAMEAADGAYAADPQRGARTLPHIELARSWVLAARGDRAEAAQRCLALAMAMEVAAKPLAVELLHAAARLGRPEDAAPGLARLAEVVDGPLVGVASAHADALVAADGDALVAVADRLEAIGRDLLAAEALRSADNAFRRAGRGAPSSSAGRRCSDLLARCGHPVSPALEPVVPAGGDLTAREAEVAQLAARGRTSPEIAEALFLSVRTVDTHLSRVYRKLMVSGRHELADALGVTGT